MRTNKGGWQIVISAVIVILAVVVFILTAGKVHNQQIADKDRTIKQLQNCNDELALQCFEQQKELDNRLSLLKYTARYLDGKAKGLNPKWGEK